MPIEDWILPSTSERIAKWIDERVAPRRWIGLLAITLAFGLGVAALVLFIVSPQAPLGPNTSDLAVQLNDLDRVKNSLERVGAFIEAQRSIVQREQSAIAELSKEKEMLEPLAGHERDAAEYFLTVTAQRARRDRWVDLSLGTLFGIFSHFLASVFFKVIRLWNGSRDRSITKARPSTA